MRALPPHKEQDPLAWPEDAAREEEPWRGPSAWQACRRGLRLAYDSPAVTLLGSLAWALLVPTLAAVALGALRGQVAGYLAAVLLLPALGAAQAMVHGAAARLATHQSEGALDLWLGLHRHFLPSLAATAVWAGLTVLGLVNLWFYLARGRFAWMLLAALVLYLLGLMQAVFCFVWPFICQQGVGLGRALRRSLLVALDNPRFTLGTLLAQALVWGLVAVPMLLGLGPVMGLSVLWLLFGAAGAGAALANEALVEVMRKYEEEPG